MVTYMWHSFLGLISFSSPTRALPVATTLFWPSGVKSRSVRPVCLPLMDQAVSPWRMMNTRGGAMAMVVNSPLEVSMCNVRRGEPAGAVGENSGSGSGLAG